MIGGESVEAKCPKCEKTEFSIVKREDKKFCYVSCKGCGTIVGVLEDIDFNVRGKTIIDNQNAIDRHISALESKIEDMEAERNDIKDIIENIHSMVYGISKKVR